MIDAKIFLPACRFRTHILYIRNPQLLMKTYGWVLGTIRSAWGSEASFSGVFDYQNSPLARGECNIAGWTEWMYEVRNPSIFCIHILCESYSWGIKLLRSNLRALSRFYRTENFQGICELFLWKYRTKYIYLYLKYVYSIVLVKGTSKRDNRKHISVLSHNNKKKLAIANS